MSLLIAARCRAGVLLASDPFVFDNDRLRPSRRLDFERFHFAEHARALFASVGALWVFHRFCRSLEADGGAERFERRRLGSLWQSLSAEWKDERARELSAYGRDPLRPVSDSLLVAVPCRRPPTIVACDASGNWTTSRTFLVTGSAAHWVREHLASPADRFTPRDSLDGCLEKVLACFSAGSRDLYVIGLPAIAIVTPDGATDLSQTSRSIWQKSQQTSFRKLRESAAKAAGASRRGTGRQPHGL